MTIKLQSNYSILNSASDNLNQIDCIISKLESLMISMKHDPLLSSHRRTINLELAAAVTELLDSKAVIYALHPQLIPFSSVFDYSFYKSYVKKNIPVKNWDTSNIDRAIQLQKIFAPSTDDEQLSLF